MNGFSTNFVRKGAFDKNTYKKSNEKNRVPVINDPELLGNFSDNFNVITDINEPGPLSFGSLFPVSLQYSKQNNEPLEKDINALDITVNNISHTEEKFQLGDAYVPAHGSNLNAPGSNNPKFSYNQLDMMENDISNLFKSLDDKNINKATITMQETHNPELPNNFNQGLSRSLIPKRMHEYERTPLIDDNIRNVGEYTTEYVIYLHSGDRDAKTYPNPFDYKIEFNPVAGSRQAYISRVFKNIKYISLKAICVPRRYYIINKITNLIFKQIFSGPPLDGSNFVNMFINTAINASVPIPYQRFRCKITYNMIDYYFIVFKHILLNGDEYYMTTYDIYTDQLLSQKVTVQIGTSTKQQIIDPFLNGGTIPANYTVVFDVLIETNYWIIIDKTNYKIKFCPKEDIFFEIINLTFEFQITETNPNLIIPNSFYQYMLLYRSLEEDRYLLLNIKEIDNLYSTYGTDQDIENSFSLLFPNYINGDSFYLEAAGQDKIYDHGTLGNITRMTIQIKDSTGRQLNVSHNSIIDSDITTPNDTCVCGVDSITGDRIRNYQCYHSYLRHPSYEKLQNILLFKVGVLEAKHNVMNF